MYITICSLSAARSIGYSDHTASKSHLPQSLIHIYTYLSKVTDSYSLSQVTFAYFSLEIRIFFLS